MTKEKYYRGKDNRIYHEYHDPMSFGYEGYFEYVFYDTLSPQDSLLLGIWVWNHNMMYVVTDNPDYDENLSSKDFVKYIGSVGEGKYLPGKSMLPTEVRDKIYNYLREKDLIDEDGNPTIHGKGCGSLSQILGKPASFIHANIMS